MDTYTIYCTPEQVHKALNLGAPIKTCGYYFKQQVGCNTISDTDLHIIPTAEQMIGWLEEQNDIDSIEIAKSCVISEHDKWQFAIWDKHEGWDSGKHCFNSRKEATLAAIDTALKYLENLKQ